MGDKINAKEWAKDFDLFMSGTEVQPPTHVSREIFEFVRKDLNPEYWKILAKLGATHAVVGSLSLLICSQFGMGTGVIVMNTFTSLGVFGCTVFCGALFLGLTNFVAGFIFAIPELNKVRRTGYSPILLLGAVSLTIFLFFGANIALNLALAWLMGALIAGVIATEVSFGIRRVFTLGR